MSNNTNTTINLLTDLENLEKERCNLPLLFADIFKNEINANDEQKMYNGIKRILKKYAQDPNTFNAVAEFTRVITGGASLEEIIQVTLDETEKPTLTSEISVDTHCELS